MIHGAARGVIQDPRDNWQIQHAQQLVAQDAIDKLAESIVPYVEGRGGYLSVVIPVSPVPSETVWSILNADQAPLMRQMVSTCLFVPYTPVLSVVPGTICDGSNMDKCIMPLQPPDPLPDFTKFAGLMSPVIAEALWEFLKHVVKVRARLVEGTGP